MRTEEVDVIAGALSHAVVRVRPLAGGFSHETCLLTLADGDRVVARLGGPDPAIEAAVMTRARAHVPVPQVLCVAPAASEGVRPAMVLEYVTGTPLSDVLAAGEDGMAELGIEVGRVIARVGAVTFGRPGFFGDKELAVHEMPPWSRQLPEMAAGCMDAVPAERGGWRVDAVLDWEFSFPGCPYADAANMTRFSDDYPPHFTDGFRSGFARYQPDELPRASDWAYLGHVLDMFALSDLVTRPPGHLVADQAARQIRRWLADGVPGSPG
jgi:aminoglycoside phosphotransferase (APT) family kinase protein